MQPHEIVITVSGILLALGTLYTTITNLAIKRNSEATNERIKELEAKTESQMKLLKLTSMHAANASSNSSKAVGKVNESMTDRRRQLGRIEVGQALLQETTNRAMDINNEAITSAKEAVEKSNNLTHKIETVAMENKQQLDDIRESINSTPIQPQ